MDKVRIVGQQGSWYVEAGRFGRLCCIWERYMKGKNKDRYYHDENWPGARIETNQPFLSKWNADLAASRYVVVAYGILEGRRINRVQYLGVYAVSDYYCTKRKKMASGWPAWGYKRIELVAKPLIGGV